MSNNDDIAGAVMAALIGQTDEKGESIADRISVSDLWSILHIVIPTVRLGIAREEAEDALNIPTDLNHSGRLVWANGAVRKYLKDGQKIMAIKEARGISGLGLKEAKDLVERMEATNRSSVVKLW